MPLYEYVCRQCAKQFTFLAGVISDNADAACPRRGSADLRKLISRVARGRSDDERMDAMADRLEMRDLDDPREMRRLAREMGREIGAETGEDMSGEMEEMIEAEARGELDSLDDSSGACGGGSCAACGGDDGKIY
jgi:putative FmdB family regulatory protein